MPFPKLPTYAPLLKTSTKQIGNYAIAGQLGEGSFGSIYLALKIPYTSRSKWLVLKKAKSTDDSTETIDELQYLNNPTFKKNCNKFYCFRDTFFDGDKRVIVLDYLPGYSLEKIFYPKTGLAAQFGVLDRRLFPLKYEDKIKFIDTLLKSLIKSLQQFHKLNLSHGDANTGNFMYNPVTRKVTVVDYGMSCKSDNVNYFAKCNAGFGTGNTHYQTSEKAYASSSKYATNNYLSTHQSDDVYALNTIITIDIAESELPFINANFMSKVPVYKRWVKAFPPEVLHDPARRLKKFQVFK